MHPEGRKRVVIKNAAPEIEGGSFPIKRVVGEQVVVQADIFADGHDEITAVLLFRKVSEKTYRQVPMKMIGSDRWKGTFTIEEMCAYFYTLEAWIDHFKTWKRDLQKKFKAGQDVKVEFLIGAELIQKTAQAAQSKDKKRLTEFAELLKEESDLNKAISIASEQSLNDLMEKYSPKDLSTAYHRELRVAVDREKALFSSWYEIFPRSCGKEPSKHGTFQDCLLLLPEIAKMGFDVLYLPPIHPIGKINRKGKNNTPSAQVLEPGSPWAIGSKEGGHKSVNPMLGTMQDFLEFVKKAEQFGVEIAMDLAFQCSPDHPYIKEFPEWFKKRPDGTIQYAENPPKKYEDIIPLNFETDKWLELWQELKDIVLFWVDKGIRIFRVDNPHTKPFPFWEWLIKEIKRDYPDVIFLAEAFTRPKVMYNLAKIGFTQSYTYFTWRNTKAELMEYLTELTNSKVREYFRPNFWTNTPDILPEYLQYGGRPGFIIRLILAATLSSNYGVYGPIFDLCINEAISEKEEYLNSEKYEIKKWNWDKPGNLKDLMARINKIRKDNPALQTIWNLRFYEVDNDHIIFYRKATEDFSNIILVAVNLDPHHTQSGWVKIPANELGIDANQSYLVHDLISDDKYIWQGERNYIELNPSMMPAYIFHIHRRMRREEDFDYFM